MIKVIAVGKIKEAYFKDACDEYLKRLKKYTKIELLELPDSNINDESKKILNKIKETDYVIALDIDGDEINSLDFAENINKLHINQPNIVFVIGGSEGLSQDIKKRSNQKLSFSKMTFPHKLFRVMFLEQLYRCYKINNNESYHK